MIKLRKIDQAIDGSPFVIFMMLEQSREIIKHEHLKIWHTIKHFAKLILQRK